MSQQTCKTSMTLGPATTARLQFTLEAQATPPLTSPGHRHDGRRLHQDERGFGPCCGSSPLRRELTAPPGIARNHVGPRPTSAAPTRPAAILSARKSA